MSPLQLVVLILVVVLLLAVVGWLPLAMPALSVEAVLLLLILVVVLTGVRLR